MPKTSVAAGAGGTCSSWSSSSRFSGHPSTTASSPPGWASPTSIGIRCCGFSSAPCLRRWCISRPGHSATRGDLMQSVNWVALSIFVLLFLLITWLGFAAARWKRGDLDLLHEWGLGGRRFGTVVTWFLVGGDVYTAYTFIAVPALAFGAGALAFFAVPYTIVI